MAALGGLPGNLSPFSMADLIDAILPAGGTLKEEFAAAAGTNVKAMIEVDGQPIVAKVVSALTSSGRIRSLVVIGGSAVQEWCKGQGIDCLPEAASGPENMFNGLDHLCQSNGDGTQPPPDKVLLVMTDLPFLERDHIGWFLDAACTGKDIYLPAVRMGDFEAAYPDCPSTFVTLGPEKLTLGGMFLFRPAAMRNAKPHIDAAFAQRKSKLGMAKLLGFGFTIRFLMKKVTVEEAEAKIVSLLGASGSPLIGAPAPLAFDIDDVFDLEYARKLKPASASAASV